MNPKLSIIIPVYNVEQYLPRCIDSILEQSFADFEAIVINDGSTDMCRLIIDEYANQDSRIKVIHQENMGVSAARNSGLRVARGKYIGFVDADDWIDPNMYKILISNMEKENCQIASCTWMDNYDHRNQKKYDSKLHSQVMSGMDYMKHLFDMPPTISGSVCLKLFYREHIKYRFDKKYFICEDNLFVAQYCQGVQKAVYINQPLYHVFNRSNSATRHTPGIVALGLGARKEIIKIAENISKDCGQLAEKVFLDQCIVFYNRYSDSGKIYKTYAETQFREYMKHSFFSVISNRTILWKQRIKYVIMFFRKW